jgi:hypothetical protein
MKLRIRGNSIRLRLSRTEVEAFDRDGAVQDAVRFGPGARLSYALERSPGEAVSARLDGTHVVVSLPASVAATWCRTDQVSVEAEQPIGDGEALRLLVEKDFTCLKTRSGEDESDAFPNPHDHC